ncbi:tetratricopeptide repeat protein [Candidatus Poribacteria bacterium]|nr:tetratricopeptide repeat protein [Candidatus Poribacteria bacterium]
MYQRKHVLFQIILLALMLGLITSTGWAGYKRINEPNPADLMPVKIYQLDNGLTVYLTENHETPRFYAEISVRAGSKHDPSESTGIAHYLEHMLFKGSRNFGTLDYEKEKLHLDKITELYEQHFHETDPEKRKEIYAQINAESQLAAQYGIPNELDKLYKTMAEQGLNAHTGAEETVYKVGLPANRLRQWAMIESERFAMPVFRLFQTELETVYEEKNRSMDNKGWIVIEAVGELLYKNHPYGQQTTIGTVEHLKNPSLRQMYEFYQTYYVPNNMAIHISGDIDSEEAIRIIDAHFSKWERKELPEPKTWEVTPIQGVERVTVKYQAEEYVLLAFRTASQNHADAEALILIDMILDNATAGLINLNLNQGQKLRRAGSRPDMNNEYGAQFLWGIPKDEQSLEEVEQLLLEQIELIKTGELRGWPKRRRVVLAILAESVGVLIALFGFWPSEPPATVSQTEEIVQTEGERLESSLVDTLKALLRAPQALDDRDSVYRAKIRVKSERLERIAQTVLGKGMAAIGLQKYDEALSYLNVAIQAAEDDSAKLGEIYFYIGLVYHEQENFAQAVEFYDSSVSYTPGSSVAWNNRGNALSQIGRSMDAVASYDRALDLRPDNGAAWFNRAIALGDLELYKEALASYDNALIYDRDDNIAWYNRGVVLDYLGLYEKAIASYDSALYYKPDDKRPYFNRGIALWNCGLYEEAVASFDSTLFYRRDDHEAWANRSSALGKLGHFDEALASCDSALKYAPGDSATITLRRLIAEQMTE